MNKNSDLNIFERYILGKALPDEVVRLKSFFENDTDLNKWLEGQILHSSATMDSDKKMKMLETIRSRTGEHMMPYAAAGKRNTNFRLYLRKISTIAAILFPVVVLFGMWLYVKPQQTGIFEVIADKGEKASLTLPEGSTVTINSDTKIAYCNDYNLKNRQIKLVGEAYFEVKHNPKKPFVVDCEDIKVTVLGTSFGVKTYEDEDHISIVLNSGRIKLTTPKEKIEMEPDSRVIYNKKTQTTICEKVNAADYTDWRKNRLRFENESLETIMRTISRMHNIDVVFENPQLKNLQFTGTINNTNIESVLDAIRLTSSINYKLKDGVVYLYK